MGRSGVEGEQGGGTGLSPRLTVEGKSEPWKKTSPKEGKDGCWAGAPGEPGGWEEDYLLRNPSRLSEDCNRAGRPGRREGARQQRDAGWKGRLWGRCLGLEISETTPCRKRLRPPARSLQVPLASWGALGRLSRQEGGLGGSGSPPGPGRDGGLREVPRSRGGPLPSRAYSWEVGNPAHSDPIPSLAT